MIPWQFQIVAFALGITIHEFAHAWAAYKLGDPTAKNEGRLSLNPLDHIDPFWTVILPAVLIFSGSPIVFGAAKPVPINPLNLRNPEDDDYWISLAGPLSNLLLAIGFAMVFRFASSHVDSLATVTGYKTLNDLLMLTYVIIVTNSVLFIFNLIPVPPLDGYHIFKSALGIRGEIPEQVAFMLFIFLIVGGIPNQIFRIFLDPLLNLLIGR
jgi:Zn-dependent protease